MSALPAFAATPVRLPAAANAPAEDRAARTMGGAILLACPVARGGLVLFGWHAARLPRQGQAVLHAAGQTARGPYRLHAWRRDESGTAWFIAAIQAREPQAMLPGALLTIEAGARATIALGTLPAAADPPDRLAERLAAECAGQPGPIALFLADLAIAAPRSAPLSALLARYLRLAAAEDGVIEIVGRAGESLVLQGWGRHAEAEPATVLLGDRAISRHQAGIATFQRQDIALPATGSVMLLGDAAGVDPATLGAVHIVCGPTLSRRPLLPARKLIDAADTAGHLRDILPRLAAAPETEENLRRLLRPRFAGHDTISALDRPVRAALDLAALFPGVGAYLCGWLADAESDVQSVALAGVSGRRSRIDAGWTRLPRPDVAQAFRGDPRFAGLDPGRPLHGFAVFVADQGGDATTGLHLDVELADTVAFLPVRPARGSQRALLRRVLESIDLHQPGAHAAIAGQVGPLLRALLREGLQPPDAELIRRGAATPRRALLLPLPPAGAPPHAALSFALHDPPRAEEGLVLVCPPCWGERELAGLDHALAAYGLDATVLRATEPCTWTEALELGARATDAPALLCLGAGVLGAIPGWRDALAARRASRSAPSVVFPTALYEDDAVRSIGVAAVEALGNAPWAALRRPQAGLPVAGLQPQHGACIAGSLAGALVSRTAWQAAGGFAAGGLLAEAQELAFFRKLAAAGEGFAHHPEVSVYALDESSAGALPRWQQAARLADGWVMAASLPGREVG
jgi:hypothetical protein